MSDLTSLFKGPVQIPFFADGTRHGWRCGAVGRVSDLQSRGRGFESRPGTQRKNSGHVSHTYVPLFTKQYKLVPAKGR